MIEPTDVFYIDPLDQNIAIELTWIGEGWEGDYDESDPEDEPMLRFTVMRLEDGEWQAVEDASYCTALPATISNEDGVIAARIIADYIRGKTHIKKTCEWLSWINVHDVQGSKSENN